MLRRMFSLLFCGTVLLGLSGCGTAADDATDPFEQWMESDRLKVLCTISMIEDIVQRIGQEEVATLTLIHRELDPHSYELVKGDTEKLGSADLIFANGLGLEHGASLASYLDNSERVIWVGDHIKSVKPEKIVFIDDLPDPHVWTDISLWTLILDPIVDALSAKLPEKAALFEQRAEILREEMLEADEEIFELLQSIPDNQRFLVTSHDAFNYFTRRYLAAPGEDEPSEWDKRFEAPEGLAPESQLSALDIRRIVSHLVHYRITVLFPESNVSQDSIRKIVDAGKKHGLKVYIAQTPLYADAMGEPGTAGDSYIGMIKHNARTIAEHLRIYGEGMVQEPDQKEVNDENL